jgi:hypothetical protein
VLIGPCERGVGKGIGAEVEAWPKDSWARFPSDLWRVGGVGPGVVGGDTEEGGGDSEEGGGDGDIDPEQGGWVRKVWRQASISAIGAAVSSDWVSYLLLVYWALFGC